jgi:hypothetical protein
MQKFSWNQRIVSQSVIPGLCRTSVPCEVSGLPSKTLWNGCVGRAPHAIILGLLANLGRGLLQGSERAPGLSSVLFRCVIVDWLIDLSLGACLFQPLQPTPQGNVNL